MSQLDQLLYTWARRGPRGHSGFQAVAATPRLADERSSLTQAALRLCRFVPPRGVREPGEMPVSYGWLDAGSVRLVFSRSYLGQDALGRPGNFCAHIIAGRREELRAEDIVRRIGSPFWWRGENLDQYEAGACSLSTVSIDDIKPHPLPEPDPDALAALVEALMVPASRLPWLLSCGEGQLASMLAAIARRMPGVLEKFPFSTYEAADTAADFYIVGAADLLGPVNATLVPDRPHLSCPGSIRHARSILLSEEPGDRSTVHLALHAGTPADGSISLSRMVKFINLFDRLSSGCEVGMEALVPAFSRAQSANILLQIPTAMELVTDELASGPQDMWRILGSVASGLSGDILRQLGRKVGLRATLGAGGIGVAEPGEITALGKILLRAGELPVAFHTACDEAVLAGIEENPGLASGIGAGPRLRLLRAAARSVPSSAADSLLAEPEDCLTIFDTRELPIEWRARVLAQEFTHDPRRVSPIADRLRAEPELAGPLIAAMHGMHPLIPVLSAMNLRERECLVISACRSLPLDDMYQLVSWIAPQLIPAHRLGLIVQLPRLLEGGAADARWGMFAADLAHASVTAALKAADMSLIDDLPVFLRSVGDPRARAWDQLVAHLFTGRSGAQASLTPTWIEKGIAAARTITEPADFPAAVDLFLFVALTKRASADELGYLTQCLSPCFTGGTDDAVLRMLVAASRIAKHRRPDILLAPCLFMIARLIAENRVATRSGGALRNRDAQLRSEALLAWLPNGERAKLRTAAVRLGSGPARWWYSIDEPPSALRRAARRSRLAIARSHLK